MIEMLLVCYSLEIQKSVLASAPQGNPNSLAYPRVSRSLQGLIYCLSGLCRILGGVSLRQVPYFDTLTGLQLGLRFLRESSSCLETFNQLHLLILRA